MFGAMLAMCGPTSILAYAFARLRQRKAKALWLRVTERGLVPIAVGLIAASGLLLAEGTAQAPLAIGITAASTIFVWRTRRSPLWVLLAGAGLGAAFLR
jgi:chromate transporter